MLPVFHLHHVPDVMCCHHTNSTTHSQRAPLPGNDSVHTILYRFIHMHTDMQVVPKGYAGGLQLQYRGKGETNFSRTVWVYSLNDNYQTVWYTQPKGGKAPTLLDFTR